MFERENKKYRTETGEQDTHAHMERRREGEAEKARVRE